MSDSDIASHTRSHSGTARPNYRIDTEGLDIKEDDTADEEYKEEDGIDADADADMSTSGIAAAAVAAVVGDEDENEDGDDGEEVTGTEEEQLAETPQDGNEQQQSRLQLHAQPKSHHRRKKRGRRPHPRRGNSSDANTGGSTGTGGGGVNDDDDDDESPQPKKKPRHIPRPLDKYGNILPVVNYEYRLPSDPEGDQKITKDGDLLGGRKFIARTFTIKGKGNQKFMISTEPARVLGFRDSYALFHSHPNLFKYVVTQEEKFDIIDQGIIPYSYRSRPIAVITARSIFKEFGWQIIENGKPDVDDYYGYSPLDEDDEYNNDTYSEGDAVITDIRQIQQQQIRQIQLHRERQQQQRQQHRQQLQMQMQMQQQQLQYQQFQQQQQQQQQAQYHYNRYYLQQQQQLQLQQLLQQQQYQNQNQQQQQQQIQRQRQSFAPTPALTTLAAVATGKVNSTNWLYHHAAACSRFNSDMYYGRVNVLLIEQQGLRDPYTNVLHIPETTQPTRVIDYVKLKDPTDRDLDNAVIEYEVRIADPDLTRTKTGLLDVPKEIYEDLVSEDVRRAIEAQKEFEKN